MQIATSLFLIPFKGLFFSLALLPVESFKNAENVTKKGKGSFSF